MEFKIPKMDRSWSDAQNDASVARATRKKELAQANLRETQDEIRDSDIERLTKKIQDRVGQSESPKDAVRAVVEGEVYTYFPAARKASDQIAQLDSERTKLLGELFRKKPAFDTAWSAHTSAVRNDVAVSGMDMKIYRGGQSGWAVALSVVVLIVLEGVFQRRAIEQIIRESLPEAGGTTIVVTAMGTSLLLIGLSTMALFFSAKSWGEYSVRTARANDTFRDTSGNIVGENISWGMPAMLTLVTALSQLGLFFLRFETGSSDSTTQNTLIFVSALVMFSAAGVAILEFRRARAQEAATEATQTRAEEIIDNYLGLHETVYGFIPNSKLELERQREQAINHLLREFQRLGDRGGSEIRSAVNELVTESQEKQTKLEKGKTDYSDTLAELKKSVEGTAQSSPAADDRRTVD